MDNARNIYQSVLNILSTAIMKDDEMVFMNRIVIPHFVETASEKIRIGTKQDARDKFGIWSATLRASGVTDYDRQCQTAEFLSARKILGTHTTRIMRGDVLIRPEIPSSLELEQHDDVWKVRRVVQDADYVTWPDLMPRMPGTEK